MVFNKTFYRYYIIYCLFFDPLFDLVIVVNALNSSLKCVRPDASLGVRIP
jgi:hypothetical protein